MHSQRLIAELPGDGINILKNCDHIVQTWLLLTKVGVALYKGGEFAMNYIKRFQNAHNLSISVGSYYSEDQLIHTFMDYFHQGRKNSSQIAIHQAE